jgi:hypothetical protein
MWSCTSLLLNDNIYNKNELGYHSVLIFNTGWRKEFCFTLRPFSLREISHLQNTHYQESQRPPGWQRSEEIIPSSTRNVTSDIHPESVTASIAVTIWQFVHVEISPSVSFCFTIIHYLLARWNTRVLLCLKNRNCWTQPVLYKAGTKQTLTYFPVQ